jgi:hypothetical protein
MRLALTFFIVFSVAALLFTGSATSTGVSRFRETEISHFRNGVFPGATEVWRTRVWLLKKFQSIGTGVIVCTHVDLHTDIRECNGTYILPRGRIQVAGEIITRNSFQLTIIGGTGFYTGVGGTAIFAGLPNPAAVTFFLESNQ